MEEKKPEQELLIKEGIISNHKIIQREGDDLHKIQLEGSEDEYGKFGTLDLNEGDYIKFEYVKSGWYNNIKSLLEVKKLSLVPNREELKLVVDRINYKEIEPLCMELAFRFGIQKDYELDEIFALYHRLIKELSGFDITEKTENRCKEVDEDV